MPEVTTEAKRCMSRPVLPTDVNYGLSFERSIIGDHKPSPPTSLQLSSFDSTEPLERAIVIRTITPADRAATCCELSGWMVESWKDVLDLVADNTAAKPRGRPRVQ